MIMPVLTDKDIQVGAGTVRPLQRQDRTPLLGILRATGVFTDDEIEIALELIDSVLDRPEQRDYLIRVYEESGRVMGYYCVGPTPATAATYDLYWIAVDPAIHGGGVGTMLNKDAEDLIRGRGGSLVIAETSSQPRYEKTRGFYIRRGYEELARIRDYYRPGDDLVMYGKYLS
jgi:ribosomal protein S18 acetylase RimI-like enzyme